MKFPGKPVSEGAGKGAFGYFKGTAKGGRKDLNVNSEIEGFLGNLQDEDAFMSANKASDHSNYAYYSHDDPYPRQDSRQENFNRRYGGDTRVDLRERSRSRGRRR